MPVAVISETRGEPLAVLPLRDFARLIGLRSPKAGEQLLLRFGGEK
ncbi:MAG: hypothetical protein FWD17_01665 [Polyangiaceae bacterium]|nr:hypothetical protein [Polyangiaceae bacterium]